MKTSIVWFKTDLRLYDNETLNKAVAESDEIVPVYCFDDSHYTTTHHGFKKTGAFRAQFILESVADLDARLREMNSGLIVVKGKPEEQLALIAKQYNATAVYAKKEVAPQEHETDKRVREALHTLGSELMAISESTLYREDDLPYPINSIPDIFTNFSTAIQHNCHVPNVVQRPRAISSPPLAAATVYTVKDLGLEPAERDSRASIDFKGGETEGLKRINAFFFETHAVSAYKLTRNELSGKNFSSKFAPWLAQGCLSARAVYHELKEYEAEFGQDDGTRRLYHELLWRDYFCFMMCKHYTNFFVKGGIKHEPPNCLSITKGYLSNGLTAKQARIL